MRKFLAIVVCKLGRFVGKLVGKGSSMPGKFALKICPDILKRVQLPPHTGLPFGSVMLFSGQRFAHWPQPVHRSDTRKGPSLTKSA